MDLDDLLELGFLFGGVELLGDLIGAVVGLVLVAVVLLALIGVVLWLDPGLATVLALLGTAVAAGVGGAVLGATFERARRKYDRR